MKKRIFSAWIAGITAAMFTILYPEYLFLPDTYEYRTEKDCQNSILFEANEGSLWEMLHADADEIRISSGLYKFLTDEGLLWKNNNSDIVNMQ